MNESIPSPSDDSDDEELQHASLLLRLRNRVIKRKKSFAFLLLLAIIFSCLSWRVYQRQKLLYEIVAHYGSIGTSDGSIPKIFHYLPNELLHFTRSIDVVRIRLLDPTSKTKRSVNLDYLNRLYLFHEVSIITYRLGPVVRNHIFQLAKNKQIVGLNFHNTILPPSFLNDIADSCPQIKELDLADSNMQGDASVDAQLKELSVLKELVSLGLEGTTVTDAGIQQLENIETLEYLCVVNTRVSQQALDRLQTKLPKLEIVEKFSDAQHYVRQGPKAKKWAQ